MLPVACIDKIFMKMALAYGRDFIYKYEGIPEEELKIDWAETLAGFYNHPEAIAYALQNLPDGKPPTAMEFRAICRRAPKKELPALPSPKVDKVRLAEFAHKSEELVKKEKGTLDWARKPKSAHALHAITKCIEAKDTRFIPILEKLIEDGIVIDGRLAKIWDGSQWIRA